MIHIDLHSVEFPEDEEERQRAVERSGILTRPVNAELQRIVDESARIFDAPMVTISIIDRDRQWLAARIGFEAEEIPRAISFGAHAIRSPGEALVIADARRDRRFARNPLVMFSPHIRFYAGAPLTDDRGYALGTLGIADVKPRREAPDLLALSLRARAVERLLALQR